MYNENLSKQKVSTNEFTDAIIGLGDKIINFI